MFLRLTCPHVPACVGYDPHRREDVHVVDGGRRGLGHVQDDENQEDGVRERCVDAPLIMKSFRCNFIRSWTLNSIWKGWVL